MRPKDVCDGLMDIAKPKTRVSSHLQKHKIVYGEKDIAQSLGKK